MFRRFYNADVILTPFTKTYQILLKAQQDPRSAAPTIPWILDRKSFDASTELGFAVPIVGIDFSQVYCLVTLN
jgi:hypothetical protein